MSWLKRPVPFIEDRKAKTETLRAMGVDLYPAGYRRDFTVGEILDRFGQMDGHGVEDQVPLSTAGRIMALRDFGKACFAQLKDGTGQIQVYVRKDKVSPEEFQVFKLMDVGDFLGVKGLLFRTRTGELTIMAETVKLLSKSQRPLPEKWHGLTDVETRYRQRYLDLIVNDQVREVFIVRSRIIEADPGFLRSEGLSGGGDPHDAAHPGWGDGQAFQDLSQRAGDEPLSARGARSSI